MDEPELDSITVKGFKSIAGIEKLALRPINLVVGPNGSGKSNFIGVFAFLHALREGRLQDYVGKAGGADAILHFGSKVTEAIEINVSFEKGVNQYSVRLEANDLGELFPRRESVRFWNKRDYPTPYENDLPRRGKEPGISDAHLTGMGKWVRDRLGRWRLYHFHDTSSTSPMRKAADINDNRHFRPDGSNLPAFLHYLQKKKPESYGLIRGAVQCVTPFFDDFHLEATKLNPEKIRLEWRHKNSDKYFDASSLSDGTLRFIALATLFLQPETYRPSVILVDEPELGLHPYAIVMLASLIKMAAAKTQVVVSTQSPLLLDHFTPEDVLVADRVDSGTTLARLDSERLGSWLEDYSLGQLWEKNEFGGRPSDG
jgi:predicted ATPase